MAAVELSSEKSRGMLDRVQTLLESSPEGQDAAFCDLQEELRTMLEEPSLDALEQTIQILGTAVGKQKDWQTPFREAGLLDFALDGLDTDVSSLRKQFLRVIGNCVADNDLNREVVTKRLDHLITYIDDTHSTITLIVLFNLCNDFDPAKAVAASLRLDAFITAQLASHKFAPEAIDYAVDLLTWTTGKLTAEQLNNESSVSSFRNLLRVALHHDEDHYHEYVAILVHYLQDPEFQEKICTPATLDDLVILMQDFEARLSAEEIEAVFSELALTKTNDTSPSEETTVLLLSQLINSISGISATNAFAQTFDVLTPVIERIRATLTPPTDKSHCVASPLDQSPSTMAACVTLGNLATCDEVCIAMVSNWRIHTTLTQILSTTTHSALLYAATGFLRHLAFPEENRSILGDDGVIDACQHVLVQYPSDAPVTGETTALLAKLVTNNLPNITRVVAPSQQQNSTTCLQTLVAQSLRPASPLPSTALKNPSIETPRVIVNILRHLARTPTPNPHTFTLYNTIYSTPRIALPLARLVRQHIYPDARAEGLLGLGLMAQSAEGAACVVVEMQEDGGLLDAVREVGEKKDGGGGGKEYQNAMVLLQGVRENGGEALGERIRGVMEGMGRVDLGE
ncbi:hypothetical protein CC86DRAFT_363374 [Ophiobolus disseminans]|uniref:ARM repeat-containing protein n=1 Tax=Ophiobolus disseminans TaxID=1469910 RepID=A0A6A6ZDN2_9PLEO|nr:hypothetical protein CC86DRAFT_363374 [Ophiobolus disseminans]